jgi:cobalt/nickel transport system permease protein
LITAGALLLVASGRRDLLAQGRDVPGQSSAALVAVGLLIALAVALFSFIASPNPDGLERVAIDHGFMGQALEPAFKLLPDYQLPFLASPVASGVAAVVLGVLVVFVVAILIGFAGRRNRAQRPSGPADKG